MSLKIKMLYMAWSNQNCCVVFYVAAVLLQVLFCSLVSVISLQC